MTRDQFLVEREGGCWHELGSVMGDNDHLTCSNCGERRYWWFWKGVNPDFSKLENFRNPDFSKWENFSRLLELGAKGIEKSHPINKIPDITADLIAQAFGWKEAKTNVTGG